MNPSLEELEAKQEGACGQDRGRLARRRWRRRWQAPDESGLAQKVPPARSELARQVARWFGLPIREGPATESTPEPGLARPLLPEAGQILLITGPSGSGKSCLLRAMVRDAPGRVLDVNRIRLRRAPCVDQFGTDLGTALAALNRVGLGEAFTYLRFPEELSDGQRWRLRLALCFCRTRSFAARTGRGVSRRGPILVADEFCAVLDRISAAVVARALRRSIDRLHSAGASIAAAVATSHEEIEPALAPDRVVRCDFGEIRGGESPPERIRRAK